MRAKQSRTVQRKEKGHNKRKSIDIDWRDVVFRRGEDIKLTKDDHIWVCAVCNNADGSCKYAICNGCHEKHRLKKRQKIAASDLKRHKCHNEIHNLISYTDVFWCVKADNDGKEWKEEEERKLRPTGCVLCKGTFVLTSKKNV